MFLNENKILFWINKSYISITTAQKLSFFKGKEWNSLEIGSFHLLDCVRLSIYLFFFNRMYVNCSGPGFALHSDIVMPYISHYGTKEQIEKFIPRMVAGTCIGAIAMTEPGAGRSVIILWYNVALQLFENHNACRGHDI